MILSFISLFKKVSKRVYLS